MLGCFLAFRRPGGTLTQAVPPNGRHTAFACPSFAPHPTLPPPTIGLFYTDTVANQFTGVNGTLAVPGDETTACGNAVAGVPFTGPYLPFADDFSGPVRNVPKKELWALDASSTSGAMRGGPGPQTRQVRGVRYLGQRSQVGVRTCTRVGAVQDLDWVQCVGAKRAHVPCRAVLTRAPLRCSVCWLCVVGRIARLHQSSVHAVVYSPAVLCFGAKPNGEP